MRFKRSLCAAMMISLLGSTTLAQARNDLDSTQKKAIAVTTPIKESRSSRKNPFRAPVVEKFLIEGKLADGEIALQAKLKENASDDQARFELGILQFLRAVETLSQDLYRNGMRDLATRGMNLPIFRLPIGNNPNPETLTYQKAQMMFDTFRANLMRAENTMEAITDSNVKVPLHFGLIRLDLNGDGRSDDEESLWKVYSSVTRSWHITAEQARNFYISFDRGDVHWMRGYCHLISSLCEIYLAHDTRETFDCTAHLLFKKVESPFPFLNEGNHIRTIGNDDLDLFDLVAFVHLISWDVVEPKRMESALHHMEEVVAQSKVSWKYIMAETDNDREWLPNPKQTGVIPNIRVSKDMVSSWDGIMTQCGKILAGETLIPFWRGKPGLGINLRKVFLEPRKLDLVLWVQGSAAAPYLQNGPLVQDWRDLQRSFGDNFPGIALYFN